MIIWSFCDSRFVAIVSITRLRVRSWRYLVPFLVYAFRSARQARQSQGNVATSLLRDSDSTFWTRTVWATESAMKDLCWPEHTARPCESCSNGAMKPPSSVGSRRMNGSLTGPKPIRSCKRTDGARKSNTHPPHTKASAFAHLRIRRAR